MFGCLFYPRVCSSLMTQRGVVFMQMRGNQHSLPRGHPLFQSPFNPPPLLSSSPPSAEYHALQPGVLRVVHHDGQRDAEDDGASSAVATVTRELLQEAAEHVGAELGESLGGEVERRRQPLGGSNGAAREDTQIRRRDSLSAHQEGRRKRAG